MTGGRWRVWVLALWLSVAAGQTVRDAVEIGLPAGLRPPTSPVFADPAWYDIVEVRWAADGLPVLEIELAAIDPIGPGPMGMRQPIVEVYVDDGSGGASDLLPGSGLRMPNGDGWRDAVRVTGDGVWWWRADAEGERLAAPVPLPAMVDGRIVRISWPSPAPDGARLYAISGVHDPFSADGWRPFGPTPSPWAFAAEAPGPPVVDVVPGGVDAWQWLQESGALPRATGPGSGVPGASSGWVWWLLMGVGMLLAVVGVGWRAWRIPTSEPGGVPRPDVPSVSDVLSVSDAGHAAARPSAAPTLSLIADGDVGDAAPAPDQFSGDAGAKAATSREAPTATDDVVPPADGDDGSPSRSTDAPTAFSRSENRS